MIGIKQGGSSDSFKIPNSDIVQAVSNSGEIEKHTFVKFTSGGSDVYLPSTFNQKKTASEGIQTYTSLKNRAYKISDLKYLITYGYNYGVRLRVIEFSSSGEVLHFSDPVYIFTGYGYITPSVAILDDNTFVLTGAESASEDSPYGVDGFYTRVVRYVNNTWTVGARIQLATDDSSPYYGYSSVKIADDKVLFHCYLYGDYSYILTVNKTDNIITATASNINDSVKGESVQNSICNIGEDIYVAYTIYNNYSTDRYEYRLTPFEYKNGVFTYGTPIIATNSTHGFSDTGWYHTMKKTGDLRCVLISMGSDDNHYFRDITVSENLTLTINKVVTISEIYEGPCYDEKTGALYRVDTDNPSSNQSSDRRYAHVLGKITGSTYTTISNASFSTRDGSGFNVHELVNEANPPFIFIYNVKDTNSTAVLSVSSGYADTWEPYIEATDQNGTTREADGITLEKVTESKEGKVALSYVISRYTL